MAATTRTSTLIFLLLPSLVNSASCSTCSSLACSAGFISPISSRKIVPLCACSNLPMRVRRRAGEGALLVAEQLALEQLGRQRRAIDLHERLAACASSADGWRARPAPCRRRSRRESAP